MTTDDATDTDTKRAVLDAAAELIATGGTAALTTRAVATKASIQPPTLYRIFGDKRGLLAALAQDRLARFVKEKEADAPHADPVEDLRNGWDRYVAFGLENPDIFAIMNEIGSPLAHSPAALAGMDALRRRIAKIARAGSLRVAEEQAVVLVHASAVGIVSTLLALPSEEWDDRLIALARDGALAMIVDEEATPDSRGAATHAITLRAHLDGIEALSAAERSLMREWLDRVADS
jgi:AcrR family transcriptional regulator